MGIGVLWRVLEGSRLVVPTRGPKTDINNSWVLIGTKGIAYEVSLILASENEGRLLGVLIMRTRTLGSILFPCLWKLLFDVSLDSRSADGLCPTEGSQQLDQIFGVVVVCPVLGCLVATLRAPKYCSVVANGLCAMTNAKARLHKMMSLASLVPSFQTCAAFLFVVGLDFRCPTV